MKLTYEAQDTDLKIQTEMNVWKVNSGAEIVIYVKRGKRKHLGILVLDHKTAHALGTHLLDIAADK